MFILSTYQKRAGAFFMSILRRNLQEWDFYRDCSVPGTHHKIEHLAAHTVSFWETALPEKESMNVRLCR